MIELGLVCSSNRIKRRCAFRVGSVHWLVFARKFYCELLEAHLLFAQVLLGDGSVHIIV